MTVEPVTLEGQVIRIGVEHADARVGSIQHMIRIPANVNPRRSSHTKNCTAT